MWLSKSSSSLGDCNTSIGEMQVSGGLDISNAILEWLMLKRDDSLGDCNNITGWLSSFVVLITTEER